MNKLIEVYLLRHGIAVPPLAAGGGADHERPLTPEGEEKIRKAAGGMLAHGLSFDVILTSPLLRARQTADIVADVFGAEKRLKICEDLAPSGDPAKVIARLRASGSAPRSFLLVGHEPYLSELAAVLLAGDVGPALQIKKGGLCKLELSVLKYGRCASLAWLLTPRQVRKLA